MTAAARVERLEEHLYQPARKLRAVALTDREAQVLACLLDELSGPPGVDPFHGLAKDFRNRLANRLGEAGARLPDTVWSDQ